MVQLSEESRGIARDLLLRANRRLDGAAAAIAREDITEGELINHFDGVVVSLFQIAASVELTRTSLHQKVSEDEEAELIRSAIVTLNAAKAESVPASARLLDLNRRYRDSMHGRSSGALDRTVLEDTIAVGRQFCRAARVYAEHLGVTFARE